MTRESNRHNSDRNTPSFELSTPLLSTDEVARLLGIPVTTLYCWRYKGTGPKAFRVGKHLRYRLEDVIDWLERMRE